MGQSNLLFSFSQILCRWAVKSARRYLTILLGCLCTVNVLSASRKESVIVVWPAICNPDLPARHLSNYFWPLQAGRSLCLYIIHKFRWCTLFTVDSQFSVLVSASRHQSFTGVCCAFRPSQLQSRLIESTSATAAVDSSETRRLCRCWRPCCWRWYCCCCCCCSLINGFTSATE